MVSNVIKYGNLLHEDYSMKNYVKESINAHEKGFFKKLIKVFENNYSTLGFNNLGISFLINFENLKKTNSKYSIAYII